jgi:hypothetical protein
MAFNKFALVIFCLAAKAAKSAFVLLAASDGRSGFDRLTAAGADTLLVASEQICLFSFGHFGILGCDTSES